jgi:hypothetical protein
MRQIPFSLNISLTTYMRKMMKKIFVLTLLIYTVLPAFSQNEEINVAGLVFLKYQSALPEKMLSSKTVVLVSSPNREGESIAEDWHPLAEQAHKVFTKSGLDPVAYYFYDDVYSGKEVREAFAESWKKREIGHLVLILKSEVNNKKGKMRYLLLATPFNGEASLMTEGQPAWKTDSKDYKKALEKFAKAANKQTSTNLLVAEVPEYFNDVKLIKGQRVESYFTDLKLGKLAVPKFADTNLPGKRPGGLVNNLIENRLEQAKQQADQFNNELANIMQAYKFEYGLVDQNVSDEALMADGFAYVMRSIRTSGISVRRLLNYEVDEEDEYYITVKVIKGKPTMRYIPIKAPVYKYYIKNLKTGNVYLGKNWDADETWQESLKNVLYNINQELK